MIQCRSWLLAPLAVLVPATGALAAPAVHPFEAPPVLPGAAAASPVKALLATSAVSTCSPVGSLTRNDRTVAIALHLVRGRFTINNPDPTDPQPGGEDPVELRSYGGCKAGPAIEVLPGDTLKIDLYNDLSTDDPSCLPNPPSGLGLPPGVGCFNTTNLHTHGLHVSPAGNSDNVLLAIAPGTRFPYIYNLPTDHPAGTFWYHTHMHGSTAVQVGSGGAGMLIIRGIRPYRAPTPADPHPIADIDTILHDAGGTPIPEKLFLLQQIAYACFQNQPGQTGGPWQQIYNASGKLYNANSPNAVANAAWTCPLAKPGAPVSPGVVENFGLQLDSATIWDTNGRFTSINGIVQPTIELPAGQIQRWRFAHGGIHDTINLQVVRATPVRAANLIGASALVGNREQQRAMLATACKATAATLVPQFEIASDGLTRRRLHTIHAQDQNGLFESNYLQPGYRSDILVVFPQDGDYCLLDQAAPPGERASNGGGGQGPSVPQLLAYVHVRGGKPVSGDLDAYVRNALADANTDLPQPVREGLRQGDLTPWAPFLEEPRPTGAQAVNFAINAPPPGQNNPLFQINNASYDPDKVNFTRQLNTTDDWLLTAQGEPHIFHIHVNPFEVMDITHADKNGVQRSIFDANGNCLPSVSTDTQQLANQYCGMYHVFRDTVFVENGYQVHIRTTYDRYIGEFVIHCHILDHEDGGMMANISIVPDLNAPQGGLGMPMAHHHAMAPGMMMPH